MTKVVCVGEAMVELSMGDGTVQVGVAGDTLNTAIYLKRSAPDLQVDYLTDLAMIHFPIRLRLSSQRRTSVLT